MQLINQIPVYSLKPELLRQLILKAATVKPKELAAMVLECLTCVEKPHAIRAAACDPADAVPDDVHHVKEQTIVHIKIIIDDSNRRKTLGHLNQSDFIVHLVVEALTIVIQETN